MNVQADLTVLRVWRRQTNVRAIPVETELRVTIMYVLLKNVIFIEKFVSLYYDLEAVCENILSAIYGDWKANHVL